MKRLILIVAIAAHCTGIAHAENPTRISVHFDDLNLARPDGAATLYERLRAAAAAACSLPDERPLERGRRFQACVAEALAGAVDKVGQPLLNAYRETQVEGRLTLSTATSR